MSVTKLPPNRNQAESLGEHDQPHTEVVGGGWRAVRNRADGDVEDPIRPFMRGREVLVVDDDPIIRMFLCEGLAQAGYRVTTAENGAVGLDILAAHRPDVVLLDLLMPVLDGWTFLAERALQPQLIGLPVVVLSGAAKERLHEAAMLGATAIVAKPLDLEVLASVLQRVLHDSGGTSRLAPAEAPASDDSESSSSAKQALGQCPVCAAPIAALLDPQLTSAQRMRTIRAARQGHVVAHATADVARVALRERLLQIPIGRRRILANWAYRELRYYWGELDRTSVHSIDEALASAALHRFWHDASA